MRTKNDLKILNVENVNNSGWEVETEVNHKNTATTITAFHRLALSYNESYVFQNVFKTHMPIAILATKPLVYNHLKMGTNIGSDGSSDKDLIRTLKFFRHFF